MTGLVGRPRIARWLGAMAAAAALVMAPAAHAQGLIRDAEIEKVLRGYVDPIFVAAEIPPGEVELHIVQDQSINAFVTGSRTMFVHTGLITAAENPLEVKGVLGHETGHMAGMHVMRSREAASRSMGPAILSIGLGILAIAGGAPDAGVALIAGSQQFAYASFVQFSQAQESQADQAAITLLDATGQSPEGLLTFASRQFRYNEMRAARSVPPWMRTHPLWSDRIQALRQRIENSPNRSRTVSAEEQAAFELIQAKLFGYIEHPSRTYQKWPESDVSAPGRYARAIASMRSSDFTRAKREADSLLKEFPNNPYFNELMGEILLDRGLAADSVPFHRRALQLEPGSALLEVNLGRALLASPGDSGLQEGIEVLTAATRHEPENASAWRLLAEAYDRVKNDGMSRLASAELHFSINNFAVAKNFAERAKERLDRDTPAWRRAADISTIAETRVRAGRRG